METKLDLLQGTLDLLILKAVSPGPLHGYGILLRIQQISAERLQIQQGHFILRCTGWSTRA
jgi:PadR family transcriptional regulator PadR